MNQYMNFRKLAAGITLVIAMTTVTMMPVAAAEQQVKASIDISVASHLNDGSYLGEAQEAYLEKCKEDEVKSEMLYTPEYFKGMGVVNYNGYRFTWYSQRVLPGQGLVIPGRHVDEQGYVCDGDGYICVASIDFPKGTAVETPLGKKGKVYDVCPSSGTMDIYVNW